ncbi:MAG TPA: PAS domain-containing sensor histidine kinase, partial [Gammaproteobacteria bacterium]|nr:PAS domain-containing sensor histidine kinase [Gammaproteobacteria bacterium]
MSIKLRVTLALTGIVVTLLMLAQFAGLIPDRDRLIESNRAVLAESIAIHVTSLLLEQHLDNLQRDLSYYASRNDDLVSIGLRRSDGALIASYGDHDNHWVATQGMVSTHSQIKVPIWNGEKKWGEVELHFSELVQPGIKGLLENPTVQLPAGIGIASFLLFYFLLGRMLKVLDPSRAVPSKVQNALDTLAEGLLILDQKGRIQLANDAFAGFLGEEPGALVGRYANTLDWLDNDNQPLDNNAHPWMQALATGTVRKSEPLRLRTPDGRELALQVSSSPVFTEEGQSIGVLVSFDDISELRKKEVELERSKVEAESANQAKSAFLANMSHEIRTPMNAILGFTEILKRGYVQNQEESLRYLNIINSSGKNLLDLINDILDLSKVESGKMEMEICAVEPHRVIYETLQVLALRANEKGIRLDFDVIGAIPETIQSDPTRLRQMILNLVGNAIKFTDEGGISICCRLDDSGGAPMMEISITDTGIGMTPEQTEHIFDPFSQADSTTTRRFGGTGLGLSISKKFSEALGGDIKVTSKAGVGSTFTIRIATGDLSSVRLI